MNDNSTVTSIVSSPQNYPIPVDKKVVKVAGRDVELIKLDDIPKEIENRLHSIRQTVLVTVESQQKLITEFKPVYAGMAFATTIVALASKKQISEHEMLKLKECAESWEGDSEKSTFPALRDALINTNPSGTHFSIDTVMELFEKLLKEKPTDDSERE